MKSKPKFATKMFVAVDGYAGLLSQNKQKADRIFRKERIKTGEAQFWTLADILKEPELERIRF